METKVEREGPTKLRLEIEVDPEELAPHYDKTLKRLAREVNIPGFRKGKAPRAILESRLGEDAVREEVLKDALPALYSSAAAEESLRPVSLPEIEVTEFAKGKPLHFTATVEVRPELKLPEYKGIEVSRPQATANDEEVNEQLELLRERFGTLEPVGRNAAQGDYVTINLSAYRHEQQIEAASAQDLGYEVGSGLFVPELDAELEGKRTGEMFKFNAKLPERFGPQHGGEEVTFTGLVKEVQAKRLPALDDDFAKTASEFDTLGELRADISKRIDEIKASQADSEVRSRVLEDLIDRADVPVPEAMVERELERRLGRLLRDLERLGSTFEDYLERTNTTREELVASQREVASKSVAAALILEAVAEAEGVVVTPREIDEEIARMAELTDRTHEELRDEFDKSGATEGLAGDILRRKALDFLVENAKISDEPS